MRKSLKPRIWLQYKLDIPVCLKQKIFSSYHILMTISEVLFLKTCAAHKFNVNLPLALLHSKRPKLHRVLAVLSAIGLNQYNTHLQKSTNSDIINFLISHIQGIFFFH